MSDPISSAPGWQARERPPCGAILIVDDEPGIRELLRWELGSHGHEVAEATNGREALDRARRKEFDLVISDVRMPGISGIEVLRAIKDVSPETEVVIATGYAELDYAVECVRAGAFDFVQKPFDVANLVATISSALERRELRAATALYQTSQAVFACKEPHHLPETIVAVTMKVMLADDVSLMVPDAANGLCLLHSHALAPEVQAEVRMVIGERVAGRVALSREPALLPDVLGGDPRFADIASFGRVRSSIVYPLLAGDRLLGVLNISRVTNPLPFRKQDLERASVLAAQISLALDNVRLLHQVATSERLAAVGEIAAGIAHEINNPAACVLASLSYVQERTAELSGLDSLFDRGADLTALQACRRMLGGRAFLEELQQAIGDAEEGAIRICDIVRDMRSLARADEPRGVVDLNDAIRSALRVAAAQVRHRATVLEQLGSDVNVLASAGRLSQVFLNLLINAVQAFEQPSRGNAIVVASRRDGEIVVASVRDNGRGISPQLLARIFEPFFTTKGSTTGTGLGLSISRDIVRGYGGELRVESVLGGGSTFTVVLPAADVLVEANGRGQIIEDPSPRMDVATQSARRILFVDDEPAILRSYVRAFGHDHAILTAAGGCGALAILAERQDFDLIVCDVMMPEVSGVELYRRVASTHPELAGAFVFVTGAIVNSDVQAFLRGITNQVLEKPFDFAVLRELIAVQRE